MIIYLQREITNNRLVLQKNMPIFLNFTAGSILPENELASLRYIVQQNQNDTVIIKERYKMDIRYIESVNGFTVNPVCSNHFSIFMARQNTIARNLGTADQQRTKFCTNISGFYASIIFKYRMEKGAENALKNKIHSHSFVVNPDEFSCDTQFLKCPITLCVPEKGVLSRTH